MLGSVGDAVVCEIRPFKLDRSWAGSFFHGWRRGMEKYGCVVGIWFLVRAGDVVDI